MVSVDCRIVDQMVVLCYRENIAAADVSPAEGESVLREKNPVLCITGTCFFETRAARMTVVTSHPLFFCVPSLICASRKLVRFLELLRSYNVVID
jgi:hypothetical protein